MTDPFRMLLVGYNEEKTEQSAREIAMRVLHHVSKYGFAALDISIHPSEELVKLRDHLKTAVEALEQIVLAERTLPRQINDRSKIAVDALDRITPKKEH